jgi:hypothetical protein
MSRSGSKPRKLSRAMLRKLEAARRAFGLRPAVICLPRVFFLPAVSA